eukprot:COSAG02_NODE_1578_length_11853_cov_3.734048_4_plen_73_part_00
MAREAQCSTGTVALLCSAYVHLTFIFHTCKSLPATSYVVLVRDRFESGNLLDFDSTALEVCFILCAEAFLVV